MDFTEDIENALEVLRRGGTILYPTDTVWGIGCDGTNADAVASVYRVKEREPDKSCILLLADQRDLLKYVSGLDLAVFDYLDSLTKPSTIIYDDVIGVAENVTAADGSVGFRLVDDQFCKHLIKRLRKPLVSTSANISGTITPALFSEIDPRILSRVDYVVKHRQNDTQPAVPSAVIRWKADGSHEVLRP